MTYMVVVCHKIALWRHGAEKVLTFDLAYLM